MKRIILGLAVAVIVVWGGRSLFAAYEVRLLQAPESWPEKGAALFQIKQGQGAGVVASALEDKGLIRSSWAFRRLLGYLDLPESLADLLVTRLLPTLGRVVDGATCTPTQGDGTKVTDPELALRGISQGANYRQIKGVERLTMVRDVRG